MRAPLDAAAVGVVPQLCGEPQAGSWDAQCDTRLTLAAKRVPRAAAPD
jgi:hypothetical protein